MYGFDDISIAAWHKTEQYLRDAEVQRAIRRAKMETDAGKRSDAPFHPDRALRKSVEGREKANPSRLQRAF